MLITDVRRGLLDPVTDMSKIKTTSKVFENQKNVLTEPILSRLGYLTLSGKAEFYASS